MPTVEYIKRQLRTFAAFKLNSIVYALRGSEHPLISPAGSLTPEEIRELVAYARAYHMSWFRRNFRTSAQSTEAGKVQRAGGNTVWRCVVAAARGDLQTNCRLVSRAE